MQKLLLCTVASIGLLSGMNSAFADSAAAKKWIDQEFQPSSLSKDQQMSEMEWFISAAEPFKGMEAFLSRHLRIDHDEEETGPRQSGQQRAVRLLGQSQLTLSTFGPRYSCFTDSRHMGGGVVG